MSAGLLKLVGMNFGRAKPIETKEELQEDESNLQEKVESLAHQITHLTKSYKQLERAYCKATKNDTDLEFRSTFEKENVRWQTNIKNLQTSLNRLIAERGQFQQDNPAFRGLVNG